MTYIYSPDGTTAHRSRRNLPATHWEVTSVDPPEGTYHDLTPANAESWGYYELVEVPKPDDDHVRTIENIGPGLGFTEVWTFDQDLADANADQADRDADAQGLRDDFQMLKDERDQNVVDRDAAALERAQMTIGDPEFQAKWTPLDGSGTDAERIAELETLVNHMRNGQRQQWGDHRTGFANDRSTNAALIRKLRKDRDDV
jgi:hypothetical protein